MTDTDEELWKLYANAGGYSVASHFDGLRAIYQAGKTEVVNLVLTLHREAHNEYNKADSWPSGHCNHDGDKWPCATARIVGVAPAFDPEPQYEQRQEMYP